jgi:hypothetical protein
MIAALTVVAVIGGRSGTPARHEAAQRSERSLQGVERERPGEAEGGQESAVHDPLAGYSGWFFGQRAAPGRHVPAGAWAAAVRKTQAMKAASAHGAANTLSAPTWQNLGPAPTNQDVKTYSDPVWSNWGGGIYRATGRVTAMAVDPKNAQVVYEGGADGGVWKSSDGGHTWRSVSNSLATQSIGSLAIPRKAHNTLFVGTGEPNTNQDSYFGYGIYKSTDGGRSFGKIGGSTFDRMTIFRILPGARGHTVFAATNRGLYRSGNGGQTWGPVLVPGDPALFESFVTDVARTYRPHELVAAVGFRGGRSTNGLYASSDGGSTWTSLGSPPGFDVQGDLGRIALATTRQRPGLIYAAVQSATKFNTGGASVFDAVYKTTHGPAGPWTKVQTAEQMALNPTSALTVNHIGPGYQPGVQAWYNMYVSIDPTNFRDVVVGLEEVWNSRNGGRSWNVIGRYWDFCYGPQDQPWCVEPGSGEAGTHHTTHPDQHDAGWGVAGGKPVLYAGNDGGVWSQTGPNWNNDNWTNDNHRQSTTQCYSAAASGDGTVICGLQDNGFVKYVGKPLWPAIAGGDGADGVIDPDDAQNLIGSYVFLNIYESHDGGRSYVTISPDDPDPRFIAPILMDPQDKTHLVALGQEVWESTQGFDTTKPDWTSVHDLGFPHQGSAGAVNGSTIYVGWCGPCNPSSFAGDSPFDSGVATNAGGAWHEAAASGLPNRYITAIVQDPADPMHVYVTLSGYARNWIPGGGTGHVFESTDGGDSFTDISTDLPDAPVSSAILMNGNLIIGTDTAVFERSASGGWQILGRGLPTIVVSDLTSIPGSDTLVAATHGRGVWTLQLGS